MRFALLSAVTACVMTILSAVPAAQRVPTTAEQTLIGVFEGTLPCADCSGLQTRLTLYAESSTVRTSGTFLLHQTYTGRNVTFDASGRWRVVTGTPADPKASLYELTTDKTGELQFWLRASDDELRMLDRDRHEIPSPMPQTLKRLPR